MKPLNILVVDDHPVNRKLLKAQLKGEGYTLFEAANGVEALAVLETAPVELIISDILMPVMDGYRLCAEVRRRAATRELPFIFYTATYTSPADEQLCLDLGADGYLRKPVPLRDVLAAIETALASPRRTPAVTLDGDNVLKEYSERLVFKLEQKNAELAAASNQLRLQATALDTAADAILITSVDGKISWVNGAFCTATGHAREEAIGKSVGSLGLGLQDAVFHESFWRQHPEPVWRGEAVTVQAHGIHYEVVTVAPVGGVDGSMTHIVGVIHDVTESRKAEEELRATHQRLRQLLEHSSAVIFALSIEGGRRVPRFASDNMTRLFGYRPEETFDPEWWPTHLHPEDRERAMAITEAVLALGSTRIEYRLRHKDGSYRWVDDTLTLVRDGKDGAPELVGVLTDITERRQAQDELRETERRFSNMLATLDLIAIMLDRDGRITYCNDHLLRLTGWTREEVLGRDWLELFTPQVLWSSMREAYAVLLSDSPEAWHHENEILTRSGKKLLIQWNNSVLRSPAGEVIGAASIGQDVTDRRILEKQILRAQRLESLGALAGGIAHDLNNVLMPILMGVTLLKHLEPNPRSQRTIENIERSVKRGSELVKQVLLFARGAEVSQDTVHLGDIVREIEAIVRSTFPKNITLEVAVAGDLRPVIGDITQLTQVLLNLCVNARDAMRRGGQLSISASNADLTGEDARRYGGMAGGPHVVLEVTDTGEGMSQEIVDQIFDPFFTTKEIGMGTGLGLSMVQGIVGSHHGFVSVSSNVGEGSTFRIHLPAGVAAAAATALEDVATPIPHGRGELIMVVDDDATVASMTGQTLETFGYRVVAAEDGAQAIGLFARRHAEIAVVLTDMAMPVIDGHALIAALTRIDPGVRIVAATGTTTATHMKKIASTGVTHILTKPYTTDHLLRTIADVLAKGG